jgi:predicted component of viral defense system (DUF524 family)
LSNIRSFTFSKPERGRLDLELDIPSKQVYAGTLPDRIPFTCQGLENISTEVMEPVRFFEWQQIQYTYVIEKDNPFSAPFQFRINDRVLKTSKFQSEVHILSGQFSFIDQVGETRIEIRDASNSLVFSMETEVFPQKMDYKSDYKAMMADISLIIQNLAYEALKDTYRKAKARLSGEAIQNEWWNILDVLFDKLLLSLSVIRRQPKHEIRTSDKVLPVERVKQASKHSINWFLKNTHYSNQSGIGIRVIDNHSYTHALSSKKYVTYDTYENRFVVWAIKKIINQLSNYRSHVEKNQGNSDYLPLIKRMKEYQSRLQGILHETPFNEVGEFEKRSHFSTSLTRGTGYSDFLRIYLLLSKGLEITSNEIFKIEQKDVSLLYEYWCFLKLVQLLKEQNASNIEYQDLIKVHAGKYEVCLKKGHESKITFVKSDSKETTTIYYNREFKKGSGKIFTYAQKPDYAIEFKKKGYKQPFWYLFDAKYRFDEDSQSENNNYNVPQDAIGQLHRYRDAILHTQPTSTTYRSAIKNLGGIILYPYPLSESEFHKNNYFKSINEVNIGALPFLPSKTKLVNNLLEELINKMPEEHFEQFIEMDRSEYDDLRNQWKDWVTIVSIPKEKQLDRINFIKDKLVGHIPFVRDLNSKTYLTKKLLLCQAGTNNALLFDVIDWEVLTDRELKLLGTTWNHREEKYIAFHLSEERQLILPDKVAPIKFRYTTSEGLNRYLKSPRVNRNYFYMTNADASRLYDELTNKKIPFKLKWGNDDADPSLIQFNLDSVTIFSSDKYKPLHFLLDKFEMSLSEIIKKLQE